jgi:hypothetical protein
MRTSIIPDGRPPSLARPDLNVKLQRPVPNVDFRTTAAAERAFDLSSLLPAPLTEATDIHDVQLQVQVTPFPAEMEVAKGPHCLDGD